MPITANKHKPQRGRSIKEALRLTPKMAPAPSRASTPPASQGHISEGDDDGSRHSSPSPSRMRSSDAALLTQIDKMLHKALQATSKQITDKLLQEIRELGQRTSDLEDRVDSVDASIVSHGADLEALRDDNHQLSSKLEDLENRSRRSNIRLRGIPEHVTDLQSTVTALFQEIAPSIPIERMEFERIHRALVRHNKEGPPRDVIVKFQFYRTKETIMQLARGRDTLTFQGFTYQLFADLAPSTITKRREMKPAIQVLQLHHLPYKWGFPFRLIFTYQSRQWHGTTLSEIREILHDLGLWETADPTTSVQSRMGRSPLPISSLPTQRKPRRSPAPASMNPPRSIDPLNPPG